MNIDTFIYLDTVRKDLLALPGITEKVCFGTPAFYVNDKLFARLKEDGKTLVIHTTEREKWIHSKPKTFFITDHYKSYSYMLINLKTVVPADLKELLTRGWYNRAPKRLIKEFDLNKT
ncbi:MAG: MmcQ/YjbR family DNA-binding protein [Ginsengibacter sp.]